jgi:Bacterial TSP3 repeat
MLRGRKGEIMPAHRVLGWQGLLLVVVILTLGGLGFASAARSNADVFTERVVIDETAFDEITSDYCGFPVETRTQARLVFISHEVNGTRFLNVSAGPTRLTHTNLETGRSIQALSTVVFQDSFVVSGSSFKGVFRGQGLNYLIRTPKGTFTSGGSVALGIKATLDESGALTSVDVFGHVFTPHLFHYYPVLCVYLGAIDSDDDFLPDTQGIRTEEAFGTDPNDPDTDGDGYLDGLEVANETDPQNPASHPQGAIGDIDKDDDYLEDGTEVFIGTDSTDPDTDDDGYLDGLEWYVYGTDPADAGSHP